ncbi:alternate-type signal peptide domain-containing protein [Arthrobacter sp. VKM Ac-2550]|uniref:alternate-type signal peptide domain-containing protein n=1 Tax=Crystallibacter permensis TaxID=1938888 RepID=UPI002227E291|nr:alternate-type signal peptide domain-containing protein [Arthrobacter sp. VKM Ac-2550]MCW2131450.1 alternate signal-mediated exported protein, RER_14450 family [Arthrobacter sp. VKM Ac-2550]
MNKMTKGSIATGVGVALLLGGGGTLAMWNINEPSDAGSIKSGNMTLEASVGEWTINGDTFLSAAQISSHPIVPGDVLTYSQNLKVGLVGDLRARLTVEKPQDDATNFDADTFEISEVVLKDAIGGSAVANPLTAPESSVTATTTFTFRGDTGELPGDMGNESMDATYNFGTVQYRLEQLEL